MVIPFFSIDISYKDLLSSLNILKKRNTSYTDLNNILSKYYPNKNLSFLPSARLAFYLSLKFYFNKGDEIIFSALSFPLYVKIAHQLGLKPILVDVEYDNLNIDENKIETNITNKTKAIVVTHLFGHPAKIDRIKKITNKYKLILIEDCAQSFESKYKNEFLGNFGDIGIISCSLMKTPTTLGGGILITKDYLFKEFVDEQLKLINTNFYNKFIYNIKNLISILNSYPFIYSILSNHIFGLLKKRSPNKLRKILYSGMGMLNNKYDWKERPDLQNYQLRFGLSQFKRSQSMNNKRRRFANLLNNGLKHNQKIKLFKESSDAYWNYSYYVIDAGEHFKEIYDTLFDKGIHIMEENVWDCTKYNIPFSSNDDLETAKNRNANLLRIQNNSFLKEEDILFIIETINKI